MPSQHEISLFNDGEFLTNEGYQQDQNGVWFKLYCNGLLKVIVHKRETGFNEWRGFILRCDPKTGVAKSELYRGQGGGIGIVTYAMNIRIKEYTDAVWLLKL